MATAIPAKGSTGQFGVDKCLEFIEENGDTETDIIIKSDQEPAIELLMKEITEARPKRKTIPEEAAKTPSLKILEMAHKWKKQKTEHTEEFREEVD